MKLYDNKTLGRTSLCMGCYAASSAPTSPVSWETWSTTLPDRPMRSGCCGRFRENAVKVRSCLVRHRYWAAWANRLLKNPLAAPRGVGYGLKMLLYSPSTLRFFTISTLPGIHQRVLQQPAKSTSIPYRRNNEIHRTGRFHFYSTANLALCYQSEKFNIKTHKNIR